MPTPKIETEYPLGVTSRRTIPGHQGMVTDISWSPTGRTLASSSLDNIVRLWDTPTGQPRRMLRGHSEGVYCIGWSPDAPILVAGCGDGRIWVWNYESGAPERVLEGHTKTVFSLAWSPDGRTLVSGSEDKTIRFWDVVTGNMYGMLEEDDPIDVLAWAPGGQVLASGSWGQAVRLWDSATGRLINTLDGGMVRDSAQARGAPMGLRRYWSPLSAVAWSPDAQMLASTSGEASSVSLWNPVTGYRTNILEGHTSDVVALSFSPDGQLLASKSLDGEIRIWRRTPWETVADFWETHRGANAWSRLAFHPQRPILAALGEKDNSIVIWELDAETLQDAPPITPTTHYINAKAVLVGESGVGKSGLGIRIAERAFRPTDSTHGAQFWHLRVPPSMLANIPEARHVQAEVTLWDFAGQQEYRLIHQLFLDDTNVALLLFDCSDATDPFRGVPYWAKVLRKHASKRTRKFLVSARCDVSPVTVTHSEIYRCLGQHELDDYFCTSAKTGEGITELVDRLFSVIPWEELPRITTPLLFQVIRGYLLRRKEEGTCLVAMDKIRKETSSSYALSPDMRTEIAAASASLHAYLNRGIRSGEDYHALIQRFTGEAEDDASFPRLSRRMLQIIGEFLPSSAPPVTKEKITRELQQRCVMIEDLTTVVGSLQARGLVFSLLSTRGPTQILLRPELINQYASSIIQTARNDKQGIGAVLERDVLMGELQLAGFVRADSNAEQTILGSTIEMLIQHDLCIREMGLLVFPSQINVTRPQPPTEQPRAEVTYRFSGAVETIYASLVVRLSHTEHFRREDQWKYAAEFSREGQRLGFSMRQVEEGTGDLEIYFDSGIGEFDRVTFIRFVTDHLRDKGIDIEERIRLYCPKCGKEVTNREAIDTQVQAGNLDIPCQYCRTAVLIPGSIEALYHRNRSYPEKQLELKRRADSRSQQETRQFQEDSRRYTQEKGDLVHILHLSDMHITTDAEARKYRAQLMTDLERSLRIKRTEYLVLTGDIARLSTQEEYQAAFGLLDGLVKRQGLDPSRVIVVPGNHDVNWDIAEEAYQFIPRRKLPPHLVEGSYFSLAEAGALVREDYAYQRRFTNFGDHFYKRIYPNSTYPADYVEQAVLHLCPADQILFLAMNSAWEIDHHFHGRASINMEALSHALEKLDDDQYNDWLKIAVFHHPITGNEAMNDDFMQLLAVHGFQIVLHGHVHEAKEGFYKYDDKRGIHIIGAGTFGAPTREQVPGIPLQYNLLTFDPATRRLTVETRKKDKPNGAWMADAQWGDRNNPSPRYMIQLK